MGGGDTNINYARISLNEIIHYLTHPMKFTCITYTLNLEISSKL